MLYPQRPGFSDESSISARGNVGYGAREHRAVCRERRRDLVVGKRGEDRQAAGTDPERMPVAGREHVGAHRVIAIFTLQAYDRPVTTHLKEGRVTGLACQPDDAFQGQPMNSVAIRRDCAEHIRFRPQEITPGFMILLGEARFDQADQNAPASWLQQPRPSTSSDSETPRLRVEASIRSKAARPSDALGAARLVDRTTHDAFDVFHISDLKRCLNVIDKCARRRIRQP